MYSKLPISSVLSQITEVYSPRLVAKMNDEYDIKVAKVKGPFIWHAHPDTDEFFYILTGSLTIEIQSETAVTGVVLGPRELFVVPKCVRHRPVGDAETMLVEKCGVVNTEDAGKSSFTK